MMRQRDLRHHRPAHAGALLRRLGLHRGRHAARACRPMRGYARGVPMGGDLTPAPDGAAPDVPRGCACATRSSANLDRIQIVKGWLDAEGETQEKVYDVVWGGDRAPGADGQAARRGQHRRRRDRHLDQHDRRARADRRLDRPGLRSRAAGLLLRPRDRDPDAALDRLRGGSLRDRDAGGRADDDHQERAYTSPIWYTPAG